MALVAAFATYFAVVKPIQNSRRIPNEEKEIFVLTGTLLWGIMIQELIAYFFTNNAKTVLPIVEGVVNILGVRTPRNEIFTAIVCCLVIALLWLLVNRTRTGKAVLAASMNPRGVTLLGLELTSIYIVVWAIYGMLAGIAGVLLGMFLGRQLLQRRSADRERVLDRGARRPRQRLRLADRRLRRRLSRNPDGLSGLAGLPHHSGAAAAGGRDVYPAAGPAGEALSMAGFFTSRLFFISLAIVVIAATLPLYVSGYILGLLTVAYLFRRVRDGLGPAVRLRRRGQFRPDLPDRRRRLHGRHPQQPVRLVGLSVHRARRAGLGRRGLRAGAAGAARARARISA